MSGKLKKETELFRQVQEKIRRLMWICNDCKASGEDKVKSCPKCGSYSLYDCEAHREKTRQAIAKMERDTRVSMLDLLKPVKTTS